MPGIVIKCDRDPASDRYVFWSVMCELPHLHGDRMTISDYLLRHENPGDTAEVQARMTRADVNGTSAHEVEWFGWDDESLIVEQRGLLARKDLWQFCELYAAKRRDEWLNLLTPLNQDEDAEVNRAPGGGCP